jgi:multiple sugar transport system permease protein
MERRRPLATVLVHCAALLLGMFVLAPLVWLFVMSISSTSDLTAKPLHWWPRIVDFSRYRTLVTITANSAG